MYPVGGGVMKLLKLICGVAVFSFGLTVPVFGHVGHLLQSLSGDFDGSGTVDFPDFIQFAGAFGQEATGNNALYDLDVSGGTIDFQDFLAFAATFGQTEDTGSGGGSTDTPTNDFGNVVTITIEGDVRVFRSNGLPDHETGSFPNSGNPHSITEQSHEYRVAVNPEVASTTTSVLGSNNRPAYQVGIAINGVPYDVTTAEFYRRDASLGWNIEAIGTLNLGLDQNQAHVQPTGSYHYHGVPWGMITNQGSMQHSALYGYAADGFPIYILYGYTDVNDARSSVKKVSPSYQLKSGSRPSTNSSTGPTGTYDGTYTQDYEYVAGLGDLDENNGRFGATPDYPNGIYHYYITDTFPFHPRSFKGTPNSTFRLGPPSGKPGTRGRRRGW
ncbi:MAG: hypothetical protein ACI8V2_000873 [Candidatus Latescibacterota bacterium]|jgi:hypothetical protein